MTLKTPVTPGKSLTGEMRKRRPYTPGAVAFVVLLLLTGVQCVLVLLGEILA
ncbi:hypothetical protein ACOY5P_23345 [Enterobacter asburiae]|uniref:hypothetical protein n=1 Tax=Enterobacter asburiae TaxID=61645 RepID=UPI002FF96FC4